MIQRIQTVWFLLASFSAFLLFVLPYGLDGRMNVPGQDLNSLTAKSDWLLATLSILTGLVSLALIFLYKNRKQQMQMSWIAVILSILALIFQIYNAQFGTQGHKLVIGLYDGRLFVGIFLPVLSIVFALLARQGIRKDEALIRSVDRLR